MFFFEGGSNILPYLLYLGLDLGRVSFKRYPGNNPEK